MSEGKVYEVLPGEEYRVVHVERKHISIQQGKEIANFRFTKPALTYLDCTLKSLAKGFINQDDIIKFLYLIQKEDSGFLLIPYKKELKGNYIVSIKSEGLPPTEGVKEESIDSILDEDSPFLILDPEQFEDEQREKRRSRTTTKKDINPILERIGYIQRDDSIEQ